MTVPPQPPRIVPFQLGDLDNGNVAALTEREAWQGLRFDDVDLSKRSLGWTGFTECSFRSLTADDVDLREAALVQCELSRVTASTFSVPSGRFRSVRVQESRFGAFVAWEAGWQAVHFVGVKLGFLNLRRAKVQDVLFSDCDIGEIDLTNARVTRMAFAKTDVAGLNLTGAKLTHVDLRTLDLRQITGIDGIRGATLTPDQVLELAPVFARIYGIISAGSEQVEG